MIFHLATAAVIVGEGSLHDRLNGSLPAFVLVPSIARTFALKLFVITLAPAAAPRYRSGAR